MGAVGTGKSARQVNVHLPAAEANPLVALDLRRFERQLAARLGRDDSWRIPGIDEAGRGPLAGPVFAAAVILPIDFDPTGIKDSKKLTERQRLAAYEGILSEAVAVGVGQCDARSIDRINILKATHQAMLAAVAHLGCEVDGILVDGRAIPHCPWPQLAIVGGDALCLSISAASIVAKVERDRRMRELDEQYPGYGFAKHKGYCTPDHLEALRRLGPCAEHRLSFAPVAEALEAKCGHLDLR